MNAQHVQYSRCIGAARSQRHFLPVVADPGLTEAGANVILHPGLAPSQIAQSQKQDHPALCDKPRLPRIASPPDCTTEALARSAPDSGPIAAACPSSAEHTSKLQYLMSRSSADYRSHKK